MRILWSALSLVFISATLPMFGQGPVLQIDPSCPVASGIDEETKEIHFTYYPQSPAAKIRDPHDLKLEVGVNGRFWRDNTRTVPFVRGDDGTWQAALSHKNQDDVWFYLIFQVRDGASGAVDDNSGLYWDAVACNSDGSQNESGVQSEAESYTGTRFDNGIGRQRDYGKAIAVLDEFMHREPAQGYGIITVLLGLQSAPLRK